MADTKPQTVWSRGITPDPGAFATPQGSMTTQLFVLNKDAKKASGATDYAKPWEIVDVGIDDGTEIIPVAVTPDSTYLYVYGCWVGTTLTTAPVIHVFGRLPTSPHKSTETNWPYKYDTTNFANVTEIWVPLPGCSDGDSIYDEYGITLDKTDEICVDDDDKFNLGKPSIVPLTGVDKILVTIQTAMVGPTAAMIVGRFVA